jgi:hypothetical protein
MKKIIYLILFSTCLIGSSSFAAAIVNGDFSSCDYTGWQQEADFDAPIPGSNDFSIVGSSPNCAAQMNVDLGGPFDAFFYTALSQELDLSGAADSSFLLSLDFSVDSMMSSTDPDFIADYFYAGVSDGLGNFMPGLFSTADVDGLVNYNLSFLLDSTFANLNNVFVEFDLYLGADIFGDTDFSGSSLTVDKVSLVEVALVPEPSTLAIFALGLAGLAMSRKKNV